jgi:predicted ATPase/class 3 adenylate cyclase
MEDHSEVEKIQQAILALEAQRQILSDQVVDMALAPLRDRLVSLQSGALGEGRKLITVLFADLVDHTTLFSRLDPEDVRELLNQYFTRWRESIEHYGGRVEKFIGDAVMAVFGMPASSEDDPEKAIRAALEMRETLEQLNHAQARSPEMRLQMRVGINTGEAVVSSLGERQGEEFTVVGETVNLASRLQAAAPSGGILITYSTYRHIKGVFDLQPVEALHVKGIPNPVQAYLVKAAKPRAFRMGRRGVEGVATRLVGRDKELNHLQKLFWQAADERQRQVVSVAGEAGIGKSRLIAEFAEWLDLLPREIYYFKGRAHPSVQNTPYSLVRDVFAFRFQIQDSDPPDVVRVKLEQGYAWAFSLPNQEAVGQGQSPPDIRPAHFVGRLLGFEFGASEHVKGAELDSRGFHGQALVYLTNYFRALAQVNPIVILLEDLHWADDSSLDLVNNLAGSLLDQPVLIVGAARSSLFERRPHWGEDWPFYTTLELGPLSTSDSRSLVEQILFRVPDLPEELCELVVSTAEGNPFYIEELLNMLIEDGVIIPAAPFWQVEAGRLADLRVPATLVGVLQARFDSLSPEQRTCLQRGSVIGRTFWDRAIEYMGESPGKGMGAQQLPASQILEHLRAREMIFERDGSTFDETNEYLFKHALLRDVTYESLLKRKRREYHRMAAAWLEQVTERVQRSDEFAALIAAHYDQAGEDGLAVEWYWRAGQGAAARYAGAEAVHAFTRALALSHDGDESRRFDILLAREKVYELQGAREDQARDIEELSILAQKSASPGRSAQAALRQAAYELSLSNFPAAIATAQKVAELAQDGQEMKVEAEAYLLQASALLRQGLFDLSKEYAQRALDLARQQEIPTVQAESLRHLGLVAYYFGKPEEALGYFESALQLYVKNRDRQGEGLALTNLGGANFELGNYQEAGAYYTRSLQLCREIGDRLGEGRALNNVGITNVVKGHYQQAEECYQQSLQIFRELGNRTFIAASLDNLGNLASSRYQYSRAQKYYQESLSIVRQIGDQVGKRFTLLNLGRNCLWTGDHENARKNIEASLSLTRDSNDQRGISTGMVNLSCLFLATGNVEEAHVQAQQALDHSFDHGLPSPQGWSHHILADVHQALGQFDLAIEHYQSALEIRLALGEAGEAIDTRRGLAETFLKKGDLESAQVQTQAILDYFQEHDHYGLDEPAKVMLAGYRVLEAVQDPRALAVLERGYKLLQECAANLEDEHMRRSFLERVPANQALVEAWNEHQEKA